MRWWAIGLLFVMLGLGVAPAPARAPEQTSATVRVAVIGDYGDDGPFEASVANLVKGWNPDFIITTGDNNYPSGGADTIDANIGQHYQAFIGNYSGSYGAGSAANRFFPSLGNHDWIASGAQPYLDYFTLPSGSPGGERYYEFTWGPLHFFAIDSDPNEPNGIAANSDQAQWLQAALAASTAPWQIVYMHHPPYSSGLHGSTPALQWPYKTWGADAVLAGHDHDYERLNAGGLPYFVVGTGGRSLYPFFGVIPESQFAYGGDYGAMRLEASSGHLRFLFYRRTGQRVDNFIVYNDTTHIFVPLMRR